MDIQLNLAAGLAYPCTLDDVIFSQAETEITFGSETLANGVSVALLIGDGETLAHALTSANKAVLNTNTVECYEYVKGLPIGASLPAYLAIGDSTKPLAIVGVQVSRNPLADIAPPTERATVWPTTAEFDALIAQMQAVQTAVNADAQEVKNISETFPTAVENAKAEFAQQAEAVTADIMQAKADAEASATKASQSASGASASANNASNFATQAAQSAEEAAAIQEALGPAPWKSVFDVVSVSTNTIILDATKAYYAKTLTESEYTFVFDSTSFALAEGQIAKINLLLDIGDVTPTVAFPANVYFGADTPVFHPGTKTMIELTSTNQGAFWVGRMVWTTSNYAYEVEYLTHSAAQYIDTGLKPLDDYVYRIKAQCASRAGNICGILGRFYPDGSRACQFSLVTFTDTRFQATWDGATGRSNGTTLEDLLALNEYVFDATGLAVNDTKFGWSSSVGAIKDGDLTMWLGGISGNPSGTARFVGNIYNFSVEQNGEKVMDLIPVVDWDGVACWHDKVSGNNFYNNGTGAFGVGERV